MYRLREKLRRAGDGDGERETLEVVDLGRREYGGKFDDMEM